MRYVRGLALSVIGCSSPLGGDAADLAGSDAASCTADRDCAGATPRCDASWDQHGGTR